jgi:hypothetical protein
VGHPGADRQDDHQHGNRRTGHRDHRDGQQHEREGQLDVDQLRDHAIEATAVVTAQQTDQGADGGAQRGGGDRDHQRDPRSPDQPAEDVAPEQIGAERVPGQRRRLPARRLEPGGQLGARG